MKKNKIIIPAMAMILFSTAASISGTVAWFTASRIFETKIGDFSVVDTEGNLDVKMAAGVGTVYDPENNSVSILSSTSIATVLSYGTGADYPVSPSPSSGDLFWKDGQSKMGRFDGSAWQPYDLDVGNFYKNTSESDAYYKATAADELTKYKTDGSAPNHAVLTHGSLNHTTAKAYVIDQDTGEDYFDKGKAGADWLFREGITKKDTGGTDRTVDVYIAVSWSMTFSYSFGGESDPVAIYLDLKDSSFSTITGVDALGDYDFRFNSEAAGKTGKGFRIGFCDAVYAATDGTNPGGPAENKHDVVWGNNTPIATAPDAYTAKTYSVGEKVLQGGKIYECVKAITSADAEFTPSKWRATGETIVTEMPANFAEDTGYAVGKKVIKDGVVYEKITSDYVADSGWDAAGWSITGEITQAKSKDCDASYVSDTDNTGKYTGNDYIFHNADYSRIVSGAESENTVIEPSRICVLTSNHPSVTVTCAAWFEGTDPNVISQNAMEALNASMTFYSRSVTKAA